MLKPDVFLINLQNTRYCGHAHNGTITENSIMMVPTDTPTRAPLWRVSPGEGKFHFPPVLFNTNRTHNYRG